MPSHFIAIISVESIHCGGMDTPIRLVSRKMQMAFIGSIINLRLQRMLPRSDDLMVGAVRMILGKDFMENDERYRVDTDISSRVLAMLLELDTAKAEVETIMRGIFNLEHLGDLEMTLLVASTSVRIPCPKDWSLLDNLGAMIKLYPFILDIKGFELVVLKE